MTTPCTATLRSINDPNRREVNVRSGPGTTFPLLLKGAVGTGGLRVLDVKPDKDGTHYEGKVYQWLQLVFPDGQTGWVRDDLVQIVGDCSTFGYGVIWTDAFAFPLQRTELIPLPQSAKSAEVSPKSAAAAPAAEKAAAPAGPAASPAGTDSDERVRQAAFNITSAFEGGGYATYQNYDKGIISYGRFQFTFAAGSLITVVNMYVQESNSPTANELRNLYVGRLNAKDAALQNDTHLRDLLIAAAQDSIMQSVQDRVATTGFWNPVHELSINPRGISSPLGRALLFDMSIQHGLYNKVMNRAEDFFKVQYKTRVDQNGVGEERFIARVAIERRDSLYRLAEQYPNLAGVRRRGDFWVELTERGDWALAGDDSGTVDVLGKRVQVRNP